MGSAQGRPTAVRSSSPRRASVLAPTAFDQHAVLDPSESLAFTLIPNTSPVALLTLHNVGATVLTFAVQTKAAHAHRFFADPPQGIVGPGKCATVVVGLKQGFCRAFLAAAPDDRSHEPYSLLVHVAAWAAPLLERDAIEASLRAFWGAAKTTTASPPVHSKKLALHFHVLKYNAMLNVYAFASCCCV